MPDANRRALEEAFEVVRTNLARAFDRQEKYYNLRRRSWKPSIGEMVWKRLHPLSSKKDAYNAKLAPKYIGPLEVRKIISTVIVDLRDARGKWHRHIHVQDLKPVNNNGVNKNLAAETEQGDPNEADVNDPVNKY